MFKKLINKIFGLNSEFKFGETFCIDCKNFREKNEKYKCKKMGKKASISDPYSQCCEQFKNKQYQFIMFN